MKRRFLGIPLFIIIIAIVAVLVIGGTAMAFFAWNGTAYIEASTATITLTQGGLDGTGSCSTRVTSFPVGSAPRMRGTTWSTTAVMIYTSGSLSSRQAVRLWRVLFI